MTDFKISWNDVHFKVREREILRGLTGAARSGHALAILGSSGAGKTTFLNAISCRLATGPHKELKGDVYLGNTPLSMHHRRLLGYVQQDDVVGAYETPTTSLLFSLRMRCGADTETARARVEEVLHELNLVKSRDTIVGVPGLVAGLSGGERKRVNIGIELIANTKVLVLDEPTSGLDSVTSENVVVMLRDISRRGFTVIYTVHQPTARMVQCFDDLLLMALGRAVYHGPACDAVAYFDSVGHPCPLNYTPTDFFMKLLQSPETAPPLVDKWLSRDPYGSPVVSPSEEERATCSAELDRLLRGNKSSFSVQFHELIKRAFRQVLLDRISLAMIFVQSLFFSLLAGLLFINLKNTVTGVQDTNGALFMIVTNAAFGGVMSTVNTFAPQKAEFIRDQQSGTYSPTLYLFTKYLAEFPLQALAETLGSVMIYFLIRLDRSADAFFIFWGLKLLLGQVSRSLGLLIASASPNIEVSSGLAPAVVVPLMLAGGLFASTDRLRPYWYWLEKPSFIRHGFVILANNQFTRVDDITCDRSKFGNFCNSTARTGREVLGELKITGPQDQTYLMWISLTGMFVIITALSIASLTWVGRTKF